ncbi:MAG: biopolymer transporter ExbD [Bacteroidota bacterium]|nr:biopolymer transporter ExbD [Bacteroidota bacterium]
MKLRRSGKFTAEVYTGSLNDIMFFLMLFFLIISTLVNPNVVKLMLPKAKLTQSIAKQQLSLSITADKRYFLNKQEIPFPELENSIYNKINDKERPLTDPTIILRADNSLTIQDLVDVLQIGSKLKVKMVLATNKSQK